MKHSWVVGLVLLAPAVVHAGGRCTVKTVKAARKAGETAMKAKQYAEAVKALEVQDSCSITDGLAKDLQVAVAWQTSDLSAAQWKAGDIKACYATAEALLDDESAWGLPTLIAQNAKLAAPMKALQHNSTACHDAIVKARGSFAAGTSCGNDGAEVPKNVLPAGVTSQCISRAESVDNDDEGTIECGAITLTSTPAGKGKPTKITLDVSGFALNEGSYCCRAPEWSFQKRGTSWAVLVETEGTDCEGAGEQSHLEEVYKLDGKSLTSEGGAIVDYH